MNHRMTFCFALFPLLFASLTNVSSCQSNKQQTPPQAYVPSEGLKTAYFASGCFWCVEAVYEAIDGVEEVISGYSGGKAEDANYEAVSSGYTKHAETVEVHYNPQKVSYETLVKAFFGSHNPTTFNRQGPDAGPQYRSLIFYQDENEKAIAEAYIESLYVDGSYERGLITTQVIPLVQFFPAEDYHQNYEKLHPDQPYIRGVSVPRLNQFKENFPGLLKKEGSKH